ncbi:ABC transporter permease [Moraxella nonliquefaciens]|jgi:amino ABC transporter, permease protein, 3-TM region, his/glu/gln/arg/opine family|uniref:Arginine ABC transporter permease protein ArtM n=1 Tax=Moraxella nonliquefaciens TaxID=478 RepID=A0A1B8PM03_MORNO|nr:ABC transporter permease [Moraxella nonliquefaciens]MDI4498441.1 ABC transporter permease [Moraxella nonliquefaciens]MDI4500191.1 ABC transporter permease [Moraxella nonliquefaciens]OBX49989.1 ABC transporter permease [Moraxella nonliquefaciens]OBX52012.1 ABC transporter permease [Moraxella nonliquefaciens]OBX87069.1 ABC transporter permease [Moraxella nonliquefaciens]
MSWNWQAIITHFPELLNASITTLELVALSSIIGLIFGVILALLRLSKNPLVQIFPFLYIFFFRGTPLLVQIFLIYHGLGQFKVIQESVLWKPILSQAYWCAIIAFTLNTAAYVAEIVRGAIQAVPHGELEAADALGMSPVQKFTHITLPRAFGIMIPAYSNEVIFMLKGSALASTITIVDLMYVSKNIIAKTYLTLEIYFAAGIIYLFISWIILALFKFFDRSFNKHKRYNPINK